MLRFELSFNENAFLMSIEDSPRFPFEKVKSDSTRNDPKKSCDMNARHIDSRWGRKRSLIKEGDRDINETFCVILFPSFIHLFSSLFFFSSVTEFSGTHLLSVFKSSVASREDFRH